MSEKLYEALERFSIMTIDADMTDAEALAKIKIIFPDVYQELIKELYK